MPSLGAFFMPTWFVCVFGDTAAHSHRHRLLLLLGNP